MRQPRLRDPRIIHLDTRRKLNVQKTLRRRLGRPIYVLFQGDIPGEKGAVKFSSPKLILFIRKKLLAISSKLCYIQNPLVDSEDIEIKIKIKNSKSIESLMCQILQYLQIFQR